MMALFLGRCCFLFLPAPAREPDEKEYAATAELDAHGDPYAFEPHGGREYGCKRDAHGPHA